MLYTEKEMRRLSEGYFEANQEHMNAVVSDAPCRIQKSFVCSVHLEDAGLGYPVVRFRRVGVHRSPGYHGIE